MKQFVAIFRVPTATMDEWVKNTPKEEMDKQMKEMEAGMNAWMAKHASSFMGKGMPLGKTKTVSHEGIKDSRNDLNYMLLVQAETHEDACAIFTDCPHVTIPDSTVEVMASNPEMAMQ